MVLNVFDFDDTLFRIPAHTTDRNFDLKGNVHTWYDDPISLDREVHRIQLIRTVADCMYDDEIHSSTENILITRRIPEMRPSVEKLLEFHNLHFKEVYVIGHDGYKYDYMAKYIKEFIIGTDKPKLQTVRILEDSMYQIMEYQDKIAKSNEFPGVNFEYYFIDKTHLIHLKQLRAESLGKLKMKYDS